MKHASEGIYHEFETQDRHHQKSETGASSPTKRTDVLQQVLRVDPETLQIRISLCIRHAIWMVSESLPRPTTKSKYFIMLMWMV